MKELKRKPSHLPQMVPHYVLRPSLPGDYFLLDEASYHPVDIEFDILFSDYLSVCETMLEALHNPRMFSQ